jgi:hypothetical protein
MDTPLLSYSRPYRLATVYQLLMAATNLPRSPALCSLGSERIETTISISSYIVGDAFASRCLAMARLFTKPLPRKVQCLSSHINILVYTVHTRQSGLIGGSHSD